MKDADLDAFVGAIERHCGMRAGRARVLSNRDFALARSWFEAGVSLSIVLAGIDRAFDAEPRVSSLAFCERHVLTLAAGERRRQPSGEPGRAQTLVARLESVREAILRAKAGAAFEKPARRIAELLDLIAVAKEPNTAYLRDKLIDLDQLLDAAALAALPPGEIVELGGQAAGAIGRIAGRVDAATLEEARRRYLRRRARERFALAPLVPD